MRLVADSHNENTAVARAQGLDVTVIRQHKDKEKGVFVVSNFYSTFFNNLTDIM